MESNGETIIPQDVEKDFAYYVSRVRQATLLYDKAIEDDTTTEHENGMALINMPALDKCQEISLELLHHKKLPPEHRILLNYYMATEQDKNLTILFLKCALEAVEVLEVIDGVVDPMREILETQLNDAMSPASPTCSPERINIHKNRFIDCIPREYSAPSILQQRTTDSPSPSLRSGIIRQGFYHHAWGFGRRINSDAQAQPANPILASFGPEIALEPHLSDGMDTSVPAPIETEPTESDVPSSRPRFWHKRHLGDGLTFDATTLAQLTSSSPHGLNSPEIGPDQPTIIVTDTDTPNSRPMIIHKIQCATARREMDMMDRNAEEEEGNWECSDEERLF